MNHIDIVNALSVIRPNALYHLKDEELTWLDENQTEPTKAEIEAGVIAYQSKIQQDQAEAAAKRQALLDKLGITEEEARLLLA